MNTEKAEMNTTLERPQGGQSMALRPQKVFDKLLYFYYCGNMNRRVKTAPVSRLAEMLAALGSAPRLRILRLLLSAHPHGLVVGEIQRELDIPGPTLSHHLERLRHVGLVTVRRERQFLWYAANAGALREILAFLYAECCSRRKVVPREEIIQLSR
jgi:DNA-binding transcriptional ArsR family regulator